VLEDRDLDRAKALVDHFLTQESAAADWHCTQCGELNEGQFHQCWSCATMRG
jgi:ABC-type ATPase with predicted acetyltransferase domain